MKMNVDSKR